VSALELENADLKERLGRGEMDAREADLKKREAILDSKSEILSKRNKGGIPDEVASILLGDLTTPGELEAAVSKLGAAYQASVTAGCGNYHRLT